MPSEAFTKIKAGATKLVQVTQETVGNPGSFPNAPSGIVYKCLPCVVTYEPVEGAPVKIAPVTDPDRAIYVANFRNAVPVLGGLYIVHRLSDGVYIFDNQQVFLENM
jgi:hypothetical protein